MSIHSVQHKTWNSQICPASSPYLIVGPEPSLLCVGPSRTSARGGDTDASVGGVTQDEGVAVGGEASDELLSWGPIVLPVVHDVILQWLPVS